jgi:glutamate carboxypeptidase
MPRLSERENHIVTRIRSRQAAMVETVTAWSGINTGSRNLAGLATFRDILAERLASLGGTIAICPPDPVSAFDERGHEVDVPHGHNIRLRKRPYAARRILLTGHMDTVFGADHPFQSVHPVSPGILNGPGVADMKGGLLVMIEALEALEAANAIPDLGWDIVINADEEVSSAGSRSLIRAAARTAQVGLTFEPSVTPEGLLAGARPGSGNFTARITGTAAHAGRNPEDGRNAVIAASALALQLSALPAEIPGLTVNVARIQGGGPSNIVPDLALLWWNMRPADLAAQDEAEAEIEDICASIARDLGVSITWKGGFARPPKPLDERHLALFTFVRDVGADLGLALDWHATGGVCDGNNIAAEGVAVIDTLGVRGGAIHTDQEYLILDSLAERASLAALTMLRLAEGRLDERIGWRA